MVAPPITRPATLEDFERLPDGPPNFEFEDGEIVAMSFPTPDHQDIVGELFSSSRRFVRERNLGRVFMEVIYTCRTGAYMFPTSAI